MPSPAEQLRRSSANSRRQEEASGSFGSQRASILVGFLPRILPSGWFSKIKYATFDRVSESVWACSLDEAPAVFWMAVSGWGQTSGPQASSGPSGHVTQPNPRCPSWLNPSPTMHVGFETHKATAARFHRFLIFLCVLKEKVLNVVYIIWYYMTCSSEDIKVIP